MSGFRKYTDRVIRQSDGCCCWRQETDLEYALSHLRAGFIACVIIALFVLVYGGILNFLYRDPANMLIVAACAAVFMLISILIFSLCAHFVDSPSEIYTMYDTYIQAGEGKTSVSFHFKGAKRVTLTPKYIQLKGRLKTLRVYVPPQDMSFVKNHILSRVSGQADIVYS